LIQLTANSVGWYHFSRTGVSDLSRSRKLVAWVGVMLIAGSALYPPWVSLWGPSGALRRPIGYYWIFSPPGEGFVTVDILRLLLEWATVAAISAAFFFATPVINLSGQIRNRLRWTARVVGWPLLTLALAIACVWLFGSDRSGHKLPTWEVVCIALALTF